MVFRVSFCCAGAVYSTHRRIIMWEGFCRENGDICASPSSGEAYSDRQLTLNFEN